MNQSPTAQPDVPFLVSHGQEPLILRSHFQPIVSARSKATVGVEALLRARRPDGSPVSPLEAFAGARQAGRLAELDQAARVAALVGFSGAEPGLMLFLNVEASLLDKDARLDLSETVAAAGLSPTQVVLEINESQVMEPARLEDFVQRHRRAGFFIAMDDLGSGHSSLQRWPVLKPDIIKVDRSLVDGIAGSFHARELLRSVIGLGRQTGALVLAEGVETEADVLACMELGVDLFQGYWFARPSDDLAGAAGAARNQARAVARRHKEATLDRFNVRRAAMLRHSRQAGVLADALTQVEPSDFCRVLRSLPWNAEVESVLLLDQDGRQYCSTLFPAEGPAPTRPPLFRESEPGDDHSDREHYYALMDPGMGRDSFLTDTHLSPATGRACRTLSHRFEHPSGGRFIICMEIGAA